MLPIKEILLHITGFHFLLWRSSVVIQDFLPYNVITIHICLTCVVTIKPLLAKHLQLGYQLSLFFVQH